MMQPLSLDALLVIVTIAEKGSFQKAADHLYRVPSAISYTVQKLEDQLEVKLFTKEGRKAVLTPAGQALLKGAKPLLLKSASLAEQVKQVATGWEPRLRIGLEAVIDAAPIWQALAELQRLAPDMELIVSEEVLGGGLEALMKDRIDLMLGVFDARDQYPDLSFFPFQEVEWVCVVPPDHPLARVTQPQTSQDLGQYPWVSLRDTSQEFAPITTNILTDKRQVSVGTMRQKIAAQSAGLGIGFLPLHLISDELAEHHWAQVPLASSVPTRYPMMLAFKPANAGRAVQWLLQRLEQQNG